MSKLTEDLLDMAAASETDSVSVHKGVMAKIVKLLEGYEWKYFQQFTPVANGDHEVICEDGSIHRVIRSLVNNKPEWTKTVGINQGGQQMNVFQFPSKPVLIRSFTPFEVQQ